MNNKPEGEEVMFLRGVSSLGPGWDGLYECCSGELVGYL